MSDIRKNMLAIDPSLNGTGLCFMTEFDKLTGKPVLTTQHVVPPKEIVGVERLAWLKGQFEWILNVTFAHCNCPGWFFDVRLVVLENYSYGSKAASAISLGEWGGILRLMLHELKIPVAFVPPSNLKQWLAGTGKANKETMISQATKRSGLDFTNSDEADAWALYAMACQHYGLPIVGMPADRAKALAKIQWPEIRDNRPK